MKPSTCLSVLALLTSIVADFTALTLTPSQCPSGTYKTFAEIPAAVSDAWLVVEAVPEQLPLKISTFAEVDRNAPDDCIIASNKLMTDGETREELFGLLTDVLKKCGMIPVTAKRESIWCREIMYILAEDVSASEEIDLLWQNMFQLPSSLPPCRLMDQVGLDTVAFIEDNYVQERGLDSHMTVDWLRKEYITPGKLGLKSGKVGLYPHKPLENGVNNEETVYLLDVGLDPDISLIPAAGRILKFKPSTGKMTSLVEGQSLPDGIDVSRTVSRIFWTNDGPFNMHTPKQLAIDDIRVKGYFCDREGMGVHRVNFDGTNHEILIRTGSLNNHEERKDMTWWCVGITLDLNRVCIYWTQKGPSKSGQRRIFRAGINIPAGQTAESRNGIDLFLEGLPEPIDLELDGENQLLYWTDRGEHPTGRSLNRVDVSGRVEKVELQRKKGILARQFHESIGIELGEEKRVYVADLGGSVYRVEDGKKAVMWRDDGCYTGWQFSDNLNRYWHYIDPSQHLLAYEKDRLNNNISSIDLTILLHKMAIARANSCSDPILRIFLPTLTDFRPSSLSTVSMYAGKMEFTLIPYSVSSAARFLYICGTAALETA
ncbi:uncharacterized protein BDW43DRAFT_302357 [Aspergillus alliaceus]|uniref:uncharacterized protein n=1 Tax=Petromyces alliaceus TaxID=209559 RepID=UPI0012A69E57|nr:uncharacterized protein BDW43DRAFT_302357 [Aspergillus alliaceus]KAB8230640.1 hypothetical protein BDW43DRAFT_302357 [Aspergillus alliaceus]